METFKKFGNSRSSSAIGFGVFSFWFPEIFIQVCPRRRTFTRWRSTRQNLNRGSSAYLVERTATIMSPGFAISCGYTRASASKTRSLWIMFSQRWLMKSGQMLHMSNEKKNYTSVPSCTSRQLRPSKRKLQEWNVGTLLLPVLAVEIFLDVFLIPPSTLCSWWEKMKKRKLTTTYPHVCWYR